MNIDQTLSSIKSKLITLNSQQNWELTLYPWLRTELTYTSNSIEGNTLSLIETSMVINENQSIAGKNLREIYEAQNHANAWDWIIENLVNSDVKLLSQDNFLKIHSYILKNIDEANAVKYRSVPVRISGSMTIFPNPLKVDFLMNQIFGWLNAQVFDTPANILRVACELHLKTVKVHPFTDGNGRSCRLIMNTILMQHGLPPIDILPINRLKYLEALENSPVENPSKFLNFLLEQYDENLDEYLRTFEG